jgi:hypothetical protein
MKTTVIAAAYVFLTSTSSAHAVTFDWATVDNPGNAGEPSGGGVEGASLVIWGTALETNEASSWVRNGDLPSAGGVSARPHERQLANCVRCDTPPQETTVRDVGLPTSNAVFFTGS